MVEAIASSLGALFINILPRRIIEKFNDKSGVTELVHMAFTVSKYPAYALVVIYLDGYDKFFLPLPKKNNGQLSIRMALSASRRTF